MEKKVSSTGMYETTYSGDAFVGKLSTPTKIGLTDQTKVVLLEYLTESLDFHTLVCDITGVERKQVKASPELEKLKEEYSHMRESYEHEKKQRNDLIRKWREETAKRLDAERERDSAQRHHKFVMDEIFSMLKEVECNSVRGIVDELKAERANGKLLEEDNELCRRENDRLKLNEALQALHIDDLLTNAKLTMGEEEAEELRLEAEKRYNTKIEYFNRCYQNQVDTIATQMNNILKLRKELEAQKDLVKKYVAKSEKLQSKLDKASKQYGELIKIINDRAIKSI
jgi:hypothetical protein